VPADLSPTARALRALEILQVRPGTTAGQLAERLGVTERAARRYVGILREAGIPVESARGLHGGYWLGRGTRLPPVVFTQAEALGLVMAVLDGQPAASDADDLVGSALGKVIQALPESVGRQAAALREHASAAPDRYSARPDPATTSALVAAAAARRRVLVTYRVDRVRAVQQTRHGFEPPDGLDPVAALEENLGTGWEFPARVAFDAPPAEVAPWIRPPMGRLHPSGDGCVLIGSTSNPAMYAQEWLASVPFAFRVDGGPELRAATAALAARLAAAMAGQPPAAAT